MTSSDSSATGGKLRLMVEERIQATSKTVRDVASHLGYPNEHMITAFLKGLTKLPLDRLRPPPVAEARGRYSR